MLNTLTDAHNIPAPKNFHLDFERGAVKAVSVVYSASKIICCDLVPRDDIVKCWKEIEKLAPYAEEGIENDDKVEAYKISLTEYLQYFEKTWIGCLNKHSYGRSITFVNIIL